MSTSGTRSAGKRHVKAIGAWAPRVVKAAFEKHGFPSAEILAGWEAIAGRDLASFTAPERIIWPRRFGRAGGGEEDTAPARRGHRPQGATLVLRVDGPRALEVQHCAAQIIDGVNAVFGYRAIAAVRLRQGPVARPAEPSQSVDMHEIPPDESALERIEDDGLRAALARLGRQVARK